MDIDIDIAPDHDPQKLFPTVIRASMLEEGGELKQHPVGYYFQTIPVDVITGLAAIPHKQTEDLGYFKTDFLKLYILKQFRSKAEMRRLQREEPNWKLLEDPEVVKNLFHLGKHFKLVNTVRPTSIQEVADVFALIRPNKRPLLYKYIKNPERYREELYTKRMPEDMRKSHAFAYALTIVLQLHLIEQGRYEIVKDNSREHSRSEIESG